MIIALSLDASTAEREAQRLGDTVERAGARGESAMASIARASVMAVAAFDSVSRVVGAVVAQMEAVHERAQALSRVRLLGGSADDVTRVEDALGGVLTKMQALRQAAEMRSLGFGEADISKYLELQRVIMGLTGASAEQSATMVQSGRLSEQALTALGKSAQGLELEIAKLAKAQGDVPPTIAQTVRVMHQYLAVSDDMKRKTAEITALSPWKAMTGAIGEVSEALANKLAAGLDSFVDRYRRAWRNVADETRMLLGRAPMQVMAAQKRAEAAAQALTGFSVAQVAASQADLAAKKEAAAIEERRAAAEKRRMDEAKKAAAELKKLREGGSAKEEEGIDEFGRRALAASIAIHAAGGALVTAHDRAKTLADQMAAAAAGGQRMAHQQAVFSALAEKGAAIASTAAIAEEKKAAALRQSLTVSDAERSNSEAGAKIAELRASIVARELATKRAIAALAESENDHAAELTKRATAALDLYRKQVAEQIKIVETSRRIAEIAAETASLKEQSAAMAQQAQIAEQIRQIQAATAQIRGAEVRDRGEAALASAAQLRATIDQLTVERSLMEVRRQAAPGDTSAMSARIEELRALEAAQWRQIAALREQAAAAAAASDAQLDLSATMKRTAADMLAPTRVIADTARQIMATTTRATQDTISAVGGLFAALVTTPENAIAAFGAALLGAAGDVALQMSAFYAALGVAEMATVVGIPKGIGLLAAAAGLAAVGGTLKGIGALVTAPPTPKTSAASGGSSARSSASAPAPGIPGQRMPADDRPVQIFMSVSEEPWNRRSDADRYRDMVRWMGRVQRQTGVKI